jgi:hypothetical protein
MGTPPADGTVEGRKNQEGVEVDKFYTIVTGDEI